MSQKEAALELEVSWRLDSGVHVLFLKFMEMYQNCVMYYCKMFIN